MGRAHQLISENTEGDVADRLRFDKEFASVMPVAVAALKAAGYNGTSVSDRHTILVPHGSVKFWLWTTLYSRTWRITPDPWSADASAAEEYFMNRRPHLQDIDGLVTTFDNAVKIYDEPFKDLDKELKNRLGELDSPET